MKKIFNALLVATLLFGVYSCVQDMKLGSNGPDGSASQIVVSMNFPEEFENAATRSLDFTSENTIDNVYVLVFDASNTLRNIMQGQNLAPAPGPDPNYAPGQAYSATYTFNVTLPPTTGASTVKLMVLANSATILAATIGTTTASTYVGKSYDEVVAAIYDNISTQMYPGTATGRIPMWGETGQFASAPANANQTVDMVRAVARIDVGVGQPSWNATTKSYTWNGNNAAGAAIPFRLTSAVVVRPNNRYTVVPATPNHTGTNVTAPTIASGTTAFSLADSKTNFTFNTTTGYVTYNMYTPEADVKMGTSGAAGDANHLNRMAIVVGGNYNNSTTTTYYRLEFRQNGNLINVLRNRLYQFNIQGATGPGSASVDDAYASQSVNMTARVVDWSLTPVPSAMDGTNTLNVLKDSIKLYSNQYTTASPIEDNVEYVWTNVPGGWTLDRIVDANNAAVTWARINPTSGPANLRSRITVSVDANNTGAVRYAYMWFAAGRMRYRAVIQQGITPAIDLRIRRNVNGSLQNVTQLVFSGGAGVTPAAQTFQVDWLPATNPVTVAATQLGMFEFPNPGGNPAVNDGAPYQGQSFQPGTGTFSYTVQPPALTAAELQANPFIKKESRFDFTVGNGFTTMTRGITLTQLNYTVIADPAPYYPLDGTEYSYRVRSNGSWRISAVNQVFSRTGAALLNNTPADNLVVGNTGGNNYTPGGGNIQTFTTANTRGNWGWSDVTYSSNPAGQFPDYTTRVVFPAGTFGVYGIAAVPSGQDARDFNYFSGATNGPTANPRQTPYTNHDIMTAMQAAINFGVNVNGANGFTGTTSKIVVPPLAIRGINIIGTAVVTDAQINDAAASGASMLVLSGTFTIDAAAANAINTRFLQQDKPVLFCTENYANLNAIITAASGATVAQNINYFYQYNNGAPNGNAPVYQWNTTADGILNGGISDLRNAYWGCDGPGGPIAWDRNSPTVFTSYSSGTNQSGNTDPPPAGYPSMANLSSMFRMNAYPFIWISDNGFMASADQSANAWHPSYIVSGTGVLMGKNNYGGGGTRRTISNSELIGNITAWAIMRRTTQN